MENEEPLSGSTSPTGPRSTISDAVPGDGDHESIGSVTSAETESTLSTVTAFVVPPAPANTPATLSVVDAVNDLDLTTAGDAIASASAAAPAADPSEIEQSDRLTTPKQAKENVTPPNEHVHEHSVWEDVARESLEIALGRAKTYAEDMHKKDDSRSEEEYYSELLADAIKKGELKFDLKYLE